MPLAEQPTTKLVAEALTVVVAAALLARFAGDASGALIAMLFLGACHVRSWRFDDARVLADGLALGGLAAPLPNVRASIAAGTRTLLLALALTFPPFVVAWRLVMHPGEPFEIARATRDLQLLGEIALVALPEEAFFRGYLQSRLAEVDDRRLGVLTRANVVASLLFAAGHFGTSVSLARASVFFPSLLFGLLRERTGGVVVAVLFHALCNVLSRVLFQGYGLA